MSLRDRIERNLEREIESIENDDSLTLQEKSEAIGELEKDARDYMRQAEEDYNDAINY